MELFGIYSAQGFLTVGHISVSPLPAIETPLSIEDTFLFETPPKPQIQPSAPLFLPRRFSAKAHQIEAKSEKDGKSPSKESQPSPKLIWEMVDQLSGKSGERKKAKEKLETWMSERDAGECYNIALELESEINPHDPFRAEAILTALEIILLYLKPRDRSVLVQKIEDETLKNPNNLWAMTGAMAIGSLTPLLDSKYRLPKALALIERIEDDEELLDAIAEALFKIVVLLDLQERLHVAMTLTTVIAVSSFRNVCKTAGRVVGFIQIL